MMGDTDGWTNYPSYYPVTGKYLKYTTTSNYCLNLTVLKSCKLQIIYREAYNPGQFSESSGNLTTGQNYLVRYRGSNWRYGMILVY